MVFTLRRRACQTFVRPVRARCMHQKEATTYGHLEKLQVRRLVDLQDIDKRAVRHTDILIIRGALMTKRVPIFNSEAEAEAFVSTADLSDFDLSDGTMMRFELKPKNKTINLRLPEALLIAVQGEAERAGIPYQRFIRMALERSLPTKPR